MSAGYVVFLHMAAVFQHEEWYLRKLAMVKGKLWVMDHTFKLAHKVSSQQYFFSINLTKLSTRLLTSPTTARSKRPST